MNKVSENLPIEKKIWNMPKIEVIEINSFNKLLEIELEALTS